jgi:hypothetical protein
LLTLVLPSLALDRLSEPGSVGPFWALVISLLFPIGFGIWCLWKKTGWNIFSILGFVTILLSGSLGLLKLDAFWFAVKESAMPLALGIAFPLSHRFGKPLIKALFMQSHVMNVKTLEASLAIEDRRSRFNAALFRASCGMCIGMIGSAVANFPLAMWLLGGKEPGSEAFVKGIAKLYWVNLVVIGVPMMGAMVVVFLWFLREIRRITHLERDDLLNPGRTVRKNVP